MTELCLLLDYNSCSSGITAHKESRLYHHNDCVCFIEIIILDNSRLFSFSFHNYNMATRKFEEMPLGFPDVEQYFKRLEFFLVANDIHDRSKAVLLANCGVAAFSLIETLISPSNIMDEEVTFDIIRTAVFNHLRPKRILHYERHLFHAMTQIDGELSSEFVRRLKDQANQCSFGDLKDDLVLSQLIFGIAKKEVRSKLLVRDQLTLDQAIQECRLQETVKMASTEHMVVSQLNKSATFKNWNQPNTKRQTQQIPSSRNLMSQQHKKPACYSCGRVDHLRANCKFRNAQCHTCNKTGHISSVCRSLKTQNVQEESDDNEEQVVMSAVNHNSINGGAGKLIYKQCKVGNFFIDFLIDSGSQVTIIPHNDALSTGFPITRDGLPTIKAFGGSAVPILGAIEKGVVSMGENTHQGRILISKNDSKPILGIDFLVPMGFLPISVNPIIQDDKSAKLMASFRLKHDVHFDGMSYAARSLPFSMKQLVEDELNRLIKEDIIYPVENPVMSAPIVPVLKQQGAKRPIRLCGDYSLTLNKVIDPDAYHIPRLEEMLEKIPSAKIYSVLDLADAYLQVSLSSESQMLTCISTHLGNFAYRKLQFGISAAPLIFQEIIDTYILKGIARTAAYQDDIIIGATSKKEHDEILSLVLRKLQKFGFKINSDKSQIGKDSVRFLGFVLKDGKLVPDPRRLEFFKNLKVPNDKEQLRSLLGTLRHYGSFCKNFSSIARPLYSLLKKNEHWKWTDVHQTAMDALLKDIPRNLFIFSRMPVKMVWDSCLLMMLKKEKLFGWGVAF